MLDQRSRRSSVDVSSTRLAIVHTCPDGSAIRAVRSPQNWSFTGIRTFAPAAADRIPPWLIGSLIRLEARRSLLSGTRKHVRELWFL